MTGLVPEQKALRLGVVGIGNIVTTTMAPAMLAEPECSLVAAVSRDQGRADAFAAEFGVGFATTDYQTMLARPMLTRSSSPLRTHCMPIRPLWRLVPKSTFLVTSRSHRASMMRSPWRTLVDG
jgi:hypothetical protein|tara:strand:- start:236 stop:604 length:369 start_codon:yes stop_codon:yes gene_type:complete